MPTRQQEAWGGEVRLPRWLRRMLRRGEPPDDMPEGADEKRKPQDAPSVLENANRAAVGPLTDLYREDRSKRR